MILKEYQAALAAMAVNQWKSYFEQAVRYVPYLRELFIQTTP